MSRIKAKSSRMKKLAHPYLSFVGINRTHLNTMHHLYIAQGGLSCSVSLRKRHIGPSAGQILRMWHRLVIQTDMA